MATWSSTSSTGPGGTSRVEPVAAGHRGHPLGGVHRALARPHLGVGDRPAPHDRLLQEAGQTLGEVGGQGRPGGRLDHDDAVDMGAPVVQHLDHRTRPARRAPAGRSAARRTARAGPGRGRGRSAGPPPGPARPRRRSGPSGRDRGWPARSATSRAARRRRRAGPAGRGPRRRLRRTPSSPARARRRCRSARSGWTPRPRGRRAGRAGTTSGSGRCRGSRASPPARACGPRSPGRSARRRSSTPGRWPPSRRGPGVRRRRRRAPSASAPAGCGPGRPASPGWPCSRRPPPASTRRVWRTWSSRGKAREAK